MKVPYSYKPKMATGRRHKGDLRPSQVRAMSRGQSWAVDPHTGKRGNMQSDRPWNWRHTAATKRAAKRQRQKAVGRLIRNQNRRQQLLFIRRSESIKQEMYDPLLRRIAKVTIANTVRRDTPKRTGRLSKSARILKGKKPRNKKPQKVRLLYIMTGGTKKAWYAHFVEFGTPGAYPRRYFFNAVYRSERRFLKRVGKLLGKKFIRRITDGRGNLR